MEIPMGIPDPVPAISIAGPSLVPAINGGFQFHGTLLENHRKTMGKPSENAD